MRVYVYQSQIYGESDLDCEAEGVLKCRLLAANLAPGDEPVKGTATNVRGAVELLSAVMGKRDLGHCIDGQKSCKLP